MGGVLFKDGKKLESRDYWLDASNDINSLEAKALLHSLLAFRDLIRDSRVDVHSDNLTLKASLDNFGGKNSSVKEILQCSCQFHFAINNHYVPSRDNLADGPLLACSALDSTLSGISWREVLVHPLLTSYRWTVTAEEIILAGFSLIFLHGPLQLHMGLMPSHSPSW